jgi:hypothetical protein
MKIVESRTMLCTALAVSLVLMGLGCGKSDPTTAEAEEIVRAELGEYYFTVPIASVSVSMIQDAEFDIFEHDVPMDYFDMVESVLQKLVDEGYITLEMEEGFLAKLYNIKLTEKGNEAFEPVEGDLWRVAMCTQEFIEVFEITRDEEASIATVSYKWRYGELTPIGEIVYPISTLWNQELGEEKDSEIKLQKVDEAWKVME